MSQSNRKGKRPKTLARRRRGAETHRRQVLWRLTGYYWSTPEGGREAIRIREADDNVRAQRGWPTWAVQRERRLWMARKDKTRGWADWLRSARKFYETQGGVRFLA